MPVPAATGPLAKPFENAADLLASSAAFRSEVGAADETAALNYIDYPYRDIEANGVLIPGAIIASNDGLDHHGGKFTAGGGELLMSISLTIDATHKNDEKANNTDFRNRLGLILNQMCDKANHPKTGGGHHLDLQGWRLNHHPQRMEAPEFEDEDETEADRINEFNFASFIIEWIGG